MNHQVYIVAAPYPDKALAIPELSMVVVSLPFAPWSWADVANDMYQPPSPDLGSCYKELPQWAAVYFFLPRSTLSLAPGDVTQFRACDIMEFALLVNSWERVLDECAGLGLFAAVCADEEEFFKKQKHRPQLLATRHALQAGVPAPLEIAGADLDISAQPWRRLGGWLGAEPFEFLAFSNVLALFDPARDAPLDALCELAPARAATK